MTTETFFYNFGHLADAPNGVKKLRELILQLAVQGKLVPQDPEDEPASVLLERIRAERKKLIQKKVISKPKSFPAVTDDEIPYAAPIGWEWIRLVDLVTLEYGKNLPAPKRKQSGGIPVYGSNGVVGVHDTALLNGAAIIVGRKGSSGALNISRTPFWPTDVTYFVVPPRDIAFDYCYLLLKSLNLDELGKGIKPGLNRNEAYPLLVPLPPLAEQKRIVAKVDQLMILCDDLETRQQKQQQGRVRLNNAALDKLLTAREPDEFTDHWQRISTNFDLLYDHPETITKLRAAILQLAVQGKLVPQDPNDEPASVLLERIRAERKKLVSDKKVSKEKSLPGVAPEGIDFDLPLGWVGVRYDTVSDSRLGKMLDKSKNKGTLRPYLRNTNVQWLKFELNDLKEMRFEDSELVEFEVRFGDLLICEGGEPGRCAIWNNREETIYFQKALHRVRPFTGVSNWYLLYRLWGSAQSGELSNYFTGATIKHFTGKSLAMFPLGLPPENEQHRIVAKVDQLMALCDELETKLNQAQQRSDKLMEATVQQLLVA